MQTKKPLHEQVAEKLIKQLQEGTAPFQKPWKLGQTALELVPYNPVTGNRYKGINALNLMLESGDDNRWLTYKQAESIGAQVRRGEKGTQIQYWQFTDKVDKRDENGKKIIGANGKPEQIEVRLERPRVFIATVFNAKQIDNMPELEKGIEKKLDWDPVERAEKILSESKAVINHDQIDRAYYQPSTDQIHLPFKDSFPDAASYYAVALHELGHWTGHESRLDRDMIHPFGSEGYAKEELRAEISSMMVGLELGLGYDPSNHASYVGSWIKVLENDPKEILRAASDSEKIFDYVLAHERQQEINMEIEKEPIIEPIKQVEKIYITVPYEDKNEAKELGAKWDRQEKSWYYVGEDNAEKFAKWVVDDNSINQSKENTIENLSHDLGTEPPAVVPDAEINDVPYVIVDKEYINVPFSDKEEAKALGAKWDKQEKSWYVDGSVDIDLFSKWTKENNQTIENPNTHKELKKEYIDVPYKDKDEVAQLGAKWDRQEKSWYINTSDNREDFEKWINVSKNNLVDFVAEEEFNERDTLSNNEKTYIAVPYEDRKEARAAGAKWDSQEKSWYHNQNDDAEKFTKWKINAAADYQTPSIDPREEFRQALQSMNIDVANLDHPIDDGKWHRLRTNDDAKGQKSASYKFYSDGRPAGVINNFKKGEVVKWVSKGYVLSDEEKANLAAISAEKNKQRELERNNNQNLAAEKAKTIISQGKSVNSEQQYLQKKGISAEKGILVDSKNNLLVPLIDVNNNVRNVQTIYADGTKLFMKDAQKSGAFHVVGESNGREALSKAENVVIAEGYATAASIKQTIDDKKTAYIVAFDAGNLRSVVENVMQEFPEKNYLIAGDDDKHLTMREKPQKNTGLENGTKVAEEFGITAVFPTFPKQEFNKNPKSLTDFNDLMKLEHGREMLTQQVGTAIDKSKRQKIINVANENLRQQNSRKRAM